MRFSVAVCDGLCSEIKQEREVSEEQLWYFTNFLELIEGGVYFVIFVLIPAVGVLVNIWYSVVLWLLGGLVWHFPI